MSKFKKKLSLTGLAVMLFSLPLMANAAFDTIHLNENNLTGETNANISIDNTNEVETVVDVYDWKNFIFTIKHDVSLKGADNLSDWKTAFLKAKQGSNVTLTQESGNVKVEGSSLLIVGDNPNTKNLTFSQEGGSLEVDGSKASLALIKGEHENHLKLKNTTLKGGTNTFKSNENTTTKFEVVKDGVLKVEGDNTSLYNQTNTAVKGNASLVNNGTIEVTDKTSLMKINRASNLDVANGEALIVNKGNLSVSGSIGVYGLSSVDASDGHADARIVNDDSGKIEVKDKGILAAVTANNKFYLDLKGTSILEVSEGSKAGYGFANSDIAVDLNDDAKFIVKDSASRGVQSPGKVSINLDGKAKAYTQGANATLLFLDDGANAKVNINGSNVFGAVKGSKTIINKGELNFTSNASSTLLGDSKGTVIENINKITANIDSKVILQGDGTLYSQSGLPSNDMPSADITLDSQANLTSIGSKAFFLRYSYGNFINKGTANLINGSKFIYASQDGGFNTAYNNLLGKLGKTADDQFIAFNNEGTINLNKKSSLLFLNDNVNLKTTNGEKGVINLDASELIKYYGNGANQKLVLDNAGKIIMTSPYYGNPLIGPVKDASSSLKVYNKGVLGKDFDPSTPYFQSDLINVDNGLVFVNDGEVVGNVSSSSALANSGSIKGNVKLVDTGSLYLKGDKAQVTGNIQSKGSFNRLYLEESKANLSGVNEVNQVVVYGDSTLENSNLTIKAKAEQGAVVTPTSSPFADLNNWSDLAKNSSTIGTSSTTVKDPSDSVLTLKDSSLSISGSTVSSSSAPKFIKAKEIKLEGENLINVDTKGNVDSLAELLGVDHVIGNKANLKSTVFLVWSPVVGKQDYSFKKNKEEDVVDAALLSRFTEIKKKHSAIYNVLQGSSDKKELRDGILATTGYEYGYLLDNLAQRLENAYDPWIRLNKRLRAIGSRNLTVALTKSEFNNGLGSASSVGSTYDSSKASNKDSLSYMRSTSEKITIGSHFQSGNKSDISPAIVDVFPYLSYGKSNYSFETKSNASSKDFEVGVVTDLQLTPSLGLTLTANSLNSDVTLNRYGFSFNKVTSELEQGFNTSSYYLSGIRGALDYNYSFARTNDWAFYLTGGYAYSYLLQSRVTEVESIPDTKGRSTSDNYIARRYSEHHYSKKVGLGLEALYEGTFLNHYAKLGFGVRSNYEYGDILDLRKSEMNGLRDFNYHTSVPKYQTRLYANGRIQLSKNGFVTLSVAQDIHNTKFTNRQFNVAYSYRSDALPNLGNYFNKMYTGQENYRGQVYFNTDFDRGTKFPYWNNGRFFRYNSVESMVYKPTLQIKLNKKTGYTWDYFLKVEDRFANSDDYTYQKKLSEFKLTTHLTAERWKLYYSYEENYKYDIHDNLTTVSYDYEVPLYIRLGIEYLSLNKFKLNNEVKNKHGDLNSDISYPKKFDRTYDKHIFYSQRTNLRLGVDHEWEIPFGKVQTETFVHADIDSANKKNRYYVTSKGELNLKYTPSFGTLGYTGKWDGLSPFAYLKDFGKAFSMKVENRLWYESPKFANFVSFKLQHDNVVRFSPHGVLDVTNTASSYLNFKFSNGSDLELFYKGIVSAYTLGFDKETAKDGNAYRNKNLKSTYWQTGVKYTYPVYNRLKLQFSSNITSSDGRKPDGYRYENYRGSITVIYNF